MTATPHIPAHVFKAYDIRGTSGTALTPDFAFLLGWAFGARAQELGERQVVVGRDGRLSGPELAQALREGLMASGVRVLDLGAVTTPMLYFGAATAAPDLGTSGIQVTGSHNPRDDNGFKMVMQGRAIYGDEIQGLRRHMDAAVAAGRATWPTADDANVARLLSQLDIETAYRERITSDCRLARPLKIVVDSGHGISGASSPAVLRALGCEVIELYSNVDGNFPDHHPDPSKPENLADLIRTVKDSGADLGIAFDGDGDRLGLVTRGGTIIYPDRQIMLYVQDILRARPGGTIIYDVKCSQRLRPWIEAAGGQALMWKTGHSLIKEQMRQRQAVFGGEMSGHIFFADRWYGFDDATYSAARLLEILSRHDDPSAVLDALPDSHSTPELNVACREGEAPQVVQALLAQPAMPGELERITLDGLRIEFADGFGLIRASNTTPVLVLRFEGTSPEALRRIQDGFMQALRQVKPDAQVGQAAH
ncbi:phosphomannomutase/phosphoglucomutase [Amphibiibacter pelophylacis]|uniref:Phosphomannomutase/phosphoglucomutase n=1 Tax=Amphibiibacter pelophylacis TaxID=1799477 RepID=A0ACC6NZA2_9BURK